MKPLHTTVTVVGLALAISTTTLTAHGAARRPPAKQAPAPSQRVIRVLSNVRASAVMNSDSLITLGSFDSKRPTVGTLTLSCKGRPKPDCQLSSSVLGQLPLRSIRTGPSASAPLAPAPGALTITPKAKKAKKPKTTTRSAAKAKGGNRTPGGVGGGASPAPSSPSPSPSPAPSPDPAPSPAPSPSPSPAPPSGPSVDADLTWDPCFDLGGGPLCLHLSFDMGGDGVVARPDGQGDGGHGGIPTSDGQPPILRTPGL